MRLVHNEPSEFVIRNLPVRSSIALTTGSLSFAQSVARDARNYSPCKIARTLSNCRIFSKNNVLDFFPGICDIGSATFNYDMRRLNEILDFPKAWYKRGLVQRLFLGKEGSYATKTSATGSEMSHEVSSPSTDEDLKRR